MNDLRIGIDLGASKTEVLLMQGAQVELFRNRIATEPDYSKLLDAISSQIMQAEAVAGQIAIPVGIGIPGTIDQRGIVKNTHQAWLDDKPLAHDIAIRLGRPVKLTNDANCFALSEAIDGAGRGYDLVFAVILGTGCGAGLAYKGQVLSGANGIAGEWGHNPLPWVTEAELESRHCHCSKRGCLGRFISGTGLTRSYYLVSGAVFQPQDITRRAAQGEALAKNVLSVFFDQLSRSLASVINLLDPDIIIVGGGVSNIHDLYPEVVQRLPSYVVGKTCVTPVVPALHGDASGVRGAAWLNPLG